MADCWILVETLHGDPARATVVGQGDRDKDWASLSRSFASRSAYNAAVSAIASATETGTDATCSVADSDDVVVARPVIGTDGYVHGLRLWTGREDAVPTQWPVSGAFDWSATRRESGVSAEMRTFLGLESDRPSFTGPEMFRSFVHLDGALGFVAVTLEDVPDREWIGSPTVRSADGLMVVRMALRSVVDADGASWRGVMFELGRPAPPPQPNVESIALAALSRESDTAIALVDLEKMRLVRWITDPVPGIAWKGVRDRRDTPHPDDVQRIVESARAFYRGATETALPSVRLRRLEGGWTVVDARATLFPAPEGPTMLLAELRTVGHSDEPDPVPSTDTGYPT